jgi:hypothetical protein
MLIKRQEPRVKNQDKEILNSPFAQSLLSKIIRLYFFKLMFFFLILDSWFLTLGSYILVPVNSLILFHPLKWIEYVQVFSFQHKAK